MTKKINVGMVGATGVVGETFLSLLEEREFPAGEIRLFASEASTGLTRHCLGRDIPIQVLSEGCFDGLDLVFFSSGEDISELWAPRAVAAGAMAIDNSSAFRMNDGVALVVPEINGDLLPPRDKPSIIANPNCSTIQLVIALAPLSKKFGLKGVRVASYQSVSGAGRAGIEELFSTTRQALEGEEGTASTFPVSIAFNCIPQIGRLGDDGFSTEEAKIMNETCKILRLPGLPVSAFTVRVPTLNCHAEVAWVTLTNPPDRLSEIEAALKAMPGLVLGAPAESRDVRVPYPTQSAVSGHDPVYVGRVHRDRSDPSTWIFWIVSDNLRKGAALNGIQMAERIFDLSPAAC